MSSLVSLMTLFLFLFSSAFSLPEKPKPAAIQPVSSTVSSIPAITIPAFPEQTDSSSTCHLNLAEDLFNGVSKACTPSSLSFSHCCPTLAAWLYSAYSSTAIAAAVKLQSSEITPLLPDDSDTCMDTAQRALRRRGVVLGAINGSCDVARCFCGVRLRRFSCPEGFKIESSGDGRWVAGDERARRIEKDCASATSTNGCNRCLRSLRQVISLFLSLSLAISLSLSLPLSLSPSLSISLSRYLPLSLYISISIELSIYLSFSPSINLSICLSFSLSLSLPLPLALSISSLLSLSIICRTRFCGCLQTHVGFSLYLSIYLCISLITHVSIYAFICRNCCSEHLHNLRQFLPPHMFYLYLSISLCLHRYASIYPSVRPSLSSPRFTI